MKTKNTNRNLKLNGGNKNMRKKEIKNNEREGLIQKVETSKINLVNALGELYSRVEETKIALKEHKCSDYKIEALTAIEEEVEKIALNIEKINVKDKKINFYGENNLEGVEEEISAIERLIFSLNDTNCRYFEMTMFSELYAIKIDKRKLKKIKRELKKDDEILVGQKHLPQLLDAIKEVFIRLYALQKLVLKERLCSDISNQERKEQLKSFEEWEKANNQKLQEGEM